MSEGLYLIWGWNHGAGYTVTNTVAFTSAKSTFNGYTSGNCGHTLSYFASDGTMTITNKDGDPFPYVVAKITQ